MGCEWCECIAANSSALNEDGKVSLWVFMSMLIEDEGVLSWVFVSALNDYGIVIFWVFVCRWDFSTPVERQWRFSRIVCVDERKEGGGRGGRRIDRQCEKGRERQTEI